jgi:A/G-specific adenine glycosylase
MLQQTQVSRVIDYYTKFLQRFPTVQDVAKASWEEFLPYYTGLGYYRRGRNMLLTTQKVVSEFGGEFPRDKKLLLSLPGVGDYTASAILSFAYGENYVAWDTNLKRVIGRFFLGSKNLLCEDITFSIHAKVLNAALMDFGSAICLGGRPKCDVCPLASKCMYFKEKGVREMQIQGSSYKLEPAQPAHEKINWKNARAWIWLHKDHTLYYSAHKSRFAVFSLEAKYTSRASMKAYFKEQYGLDLAIRPPHKKVIIQGIPTLFINAQILLGEPQFATFSKEAVKRYNETILY